MGKIDLSLAVDALRGHWAQESLETSAGGSDGCTATARHGVLSLRHWVRLGLLGWLSVVGTPHSWLTALHRWVKPVACPPRNQCRYSIRVQNANVKCARKRGGVRPCLPAPWDLPCQPSGSSVDKGASGAAGRRQKPRRTWENDLQWVGAGPDGYPSASSAGSVLASRSLEIVACGSRPAPLRPVRLNRPSLGPCHSRLRRRYPLLRCPHPHTRLAQSRCRRPSWSRTVPL